MADDAPVEIDMSKMPPRMPTTVDIHQLAIFLNCDIRTVKDYHSRGIVVRTARGKYALLPSIQRVVEHLRKTASGQQTRKPSSIDPIEESALLKRANRMRIENEAKRQAGELISIRELEEVWSEILKAVRAMVNAWPNRVAFELPHLTPHDKTVMQRVADELLRSNSLSNPTLGPLPEQK